MTPGNVTYSPSTALQGEFISHLNVDSITMAVDSENKLLVTADTSGEMKSWLIDGFCDGSNRQTADKPGTCSSPYVCLSTSVCLSVYQCLFVCLCNLTPFSRSDVPVLVCARRVYHRSGSVCEG